MTTQDGSAKQVQVLDEIIDNAIMLPVGSQDLLLMMAKAMRHTRDCMLQQGSIEQPRKPPLTVSRST